ncbi:MAG: YhdP family protein [Legionellaceae bacterium]|nr:YhdP family protein [Legionellaceae bacterium]
MSVMTIKNKRIFFKILKKCWIILAAILVAFAIIFSLFRALTPWIKQYKVEVEQHLSTVLGQPVSIKDLETSWYWFEPVLKMDQVTVSDKDNHQLKLDKLLVGINLWSSLWHWQIKPGVLYVDDVNLAIRQVDGGHWEIDGLKPNKQAMSIDDNSYLPILGWLLAQDTIIVKHVDADVYLHDGMVIPLRNLNVKADSSYGSYRLSGSAQLDQGVPTSLSLVANLQLDPTAIEKVSGNAYISVEHFLPTQWQSFFPDLPWRVKRGECDLKTWFDLKQGHMLGLQSTVRLQNLIWTENASSKERKIELLEANLAWKKNRGADWRLTADQVNLRIGGVNWPENMIQLDYKHADQMYSVFVKTLLLESLFATDIAWPDNLQSILAAKPVGELHDTQVNIVQNKVNYVLTRFNHLGWEAKDNIPAVKQISGVLFWQPTEGRLVLDAENTTIAPNKLPPLTLDLLNADIDWKELNNGFRISMDRFVLSHPNLVLSATGLLDNPRTPDGHLQLTAEFAAKNAKKLMTYIPAEYLKPKLNDWLKKDIKRIAHASGRVVVNGKLHDFPFDNSPGEFSIVSHLSGVDLLAHPNWPINRDIDADLVVNKRMLIANIDKANLQGVLLSKTNLVVNDIGLGREALLIHGQVDASGEQIKKYVFETPLRDRLSRWSVVDIHDDLALDLRLEIPLYPESDHVIALGNLAFDKNSVVIHFPITHITVDDVDGVLQFNEFGLTDGELRATVNGAPASLRAQSIIEPKEGTVLSLEGEANIEYLQKIIPSPALALLSGHVNLAALWTIYPSADDPDQLHLDSNLEGVAIDLPKPLGKLQTDATPCTLDVAFNPKNAMNVRLNYDNRLTSELFLSEVNHVVSLDRGEIRIGQSLAPRSNRKGLTIVGEMDDVDLSEWHQVVTKFSENNLANAPIGDLNNINFKFGQVTLLGQKYNNLILKANKVQKNNWSLMIDQANIAAKLNYNIPSNTFSGHVQHLYWGQGTEDTTKHQTTKWNPKTNDLPNLNIIVDEFKIRDVEVGSVDLKSISGKTDWKLDHCIITSPEYKLSLQGAWKQLAKSNHSTLEAYLEIKNLGKGLERWHVTPAVDAHQGNISFQGSWKSPFYDFSLSQLTGKMQMVLKNGRISHFDKETEEKLGLGRLLSILSLQTIPRRLQLDFSDLSEQGYSFDVFKGSFELNQGVMSTYDSYIDGPVAYAKMEGDLDLSKRLYDVNLRITPYITASLPVVATIAGGPIAGFATWVASNIINKGMQKISGYTYKISGPWTDPVVQQVSIDRSTH